MREIFVKKPMALVSLSSSFKAFKSSVGGAAGAGDAAAGGAAAATRGAAAAFGATATGGAGGFAFGAAAVSAGGLATGAAALPETCGAGVVSVGAGAAAVAGCGGAGATGVGGATGVAVGSGVAGCVSTAWGCETGGAGARWAQFATTSNSSTAMDFTSLGSGYMHAVIVPISASVRSD